MRGKLNILVLIVIVVVLAMFGSSGYLLFRGIAKFSSSEKKAGRLFKEIVRYHDKSNPFPIPPNVGRKRENAEKLETWYNELTDELRKGEVGAVERSPSKFMSLLTKTRDVLMAKAEKSEVTLSGKEDFAFGFSEYLAEGSTLPELPVVPNLSRELVVIYEVCKALIEAKAMSIEAVQRGEPSARRRPTRPRPGHAQPKVDRVKPLEHPLYAKRKFTFVFTCKERTLLQVLNAISQHKIYMEISSVEMMRNAPDVLEAAKPEKTADEAPTAPVATVLIGPEARPEARVVSGPKIETPMRVTIELHVYRFKGEASDEKS
ncbi:MAG: Amuc_1100 family pilus-like protein [Kiritimatiellia bacterium]|jgi:hypothetical protein|nr:Amuc_1100 family pilus-like protein [Kiritimatiellia bacterium]